jgi:hypothetical protein
MCGPWLYRLVAGHGGRGPTKLDRAMADAQRALLELAAVLEVEVDRQAAQGGDPAAAWELLCDVRASLDHFSARRPTPRPAAAGASRAAERT